MSRQAKGARLWLRPEKRNADGTLRERAVWVIRDGSRKISTGSAAQDAEGAERFRVWVRRSFHQIVLDMATEFFAEKISALFPEAFTARCAD